MSDTATQTTPSTPSASGTTLGDASAALALADASTAAPESATPAENAAPAATTPAATETPVQDPASAQAEETKKEPPTWRWQDILENTRKTVAEETTARVKQEVEAQYAGLKDFASIDANERAGMLLWNRALKGDAQARALVAQADAKVAASMGWTPAPADDPMPEADLQTADGTPVYSGTRQAAKDEWLIRKVTADIRKQLQAEMRPVQQVIAAHQKAESHATVASVIAEFKAKSPEFDAHKKDVGAALQADPDLWALADTHPRLAIETAWHRVWREKVLPTKDKESEAKHLASIQQRAVAAATNPAAASTSSPKSTIGDARAALEYAYAQQGS